MSVKLQDLGSELALDERELEEYLRTTNIKVPEGVKRIPDKDAARLRGLVRETRRRDAKKQETIRLPSIVSVRALAAKLELSPGDILKQLLKNGMVANLNEDLDYDTAAIIASDLGYNTEEDVRELEKDVLTPEKLSEILTKERPELQQARPPVVTIMGHVDHGKTTLLDTIRQTSVASTEAGGITQRISSYQARKKGKVMTFIDTPGHEAFEFMRKRGASLADMGILVVAADDGVKEQTREAVRHAQDADVPIVVAITKMDKPDANAEKVKRQIADLGLVPEEYGGDTPVVAVSAARGTGIDDLLDTILLVAEVHRPQAVVDRPALATVIESRRDPGMGPLASVLVHAGTLRVGNNVVVGRTAGSVRQLLDFNGRPTKEAKPSMPATIIGLEDVPNAGDILQVVEERTAARKKAASVRRMPVVEREQEEPPRVAAEGASGETPPASLDRTLPLILKADSQGSLEAVRQTVEALGSPDVSARILRADVGNITETDVQTAHAAGGEVFGFNVSVFPTAAHLAEKDGIPVQTYQVIYELTENIRQRMERLLPPEVIREDLGKLKVLKVFFSIRGRQIVGGRVTSGVVKPREKLDVVRGEQVAASGAIVELQQNRVAVDTVKAGQECGITFEGNGKIKEEDTLVVYHEEIRQRRLPAGKRGSS